MRLRSDGKLSEPNDGYALIEIPEQFLITNYDNLIHAIVKSTYPNLVDEYMNEEFLQCRTIFTSIIDTVDEINDYVLLLISGGEREYLSSDSVDRTSGLPNHKIKLKVGTPIMLLRNLDQTEGLCNGTRMIVNRLATHVIEAKVMTGKNVGKIFYIPRMSLSPSHSLRQFSLTISYDMTINKSQGQSLASVGLYLPQPVFGHGQLYVAFSRVQSMEGLKILIHDKEGKTMNTIINVVFKEVFQNL
ncbi:hypothetical protein Lal_00038875 [Lupinus albus]|nr:hypothetical protein Lal_00038875 [Lupinus albus]